MNKENTFTSTGIKLLYHTDILNQLQYNRVSPVSLQIAPTSRCQLNCVFCSNTNRTKQEDLGYDRAIDFLDSMKVLGAKTVEWTGGGDPTLYPYINDLIDLAKKYNYEQGFITNGLGFDRIDPPLFKNLKWIRISMNSLDYIDSIKIPYFGKKTVLGFSYVINSKTVSETIDKIREYIKEHSPSYVRIVPDCQVSDEEQKQNNEIYSEMIEKWGSPFFYQAKVFEKPELCYWGYLKPFVLHDGFVYRCSSVVLNDDAKRCFSSSYRWCTMEELEEKYKTQIVPFVPETCTHCVFTKQNNLINEVLHPNKMKNFI